MTNKKPREYWLTDEGGPKFDMQYSDRPLGANSIHLIEYSAFKKLREEYEELNLKYKTLLLKIAGVKVNE